MSSMGRIRLPQVKETITQLGPAFTRDGGVIPGGMDLVTPRLMVQTGALQQGSVNFEVNQTGGYGRILGYERFNGMPAPSAATFVIVQVASFTNVPEVGDDIVQVGSGASGTVAYVVNGPLYFYMVVTMTSGAFNYTGLINGVGALHITSANAPWSLAAHSPPFHIPVVTPIGTAITPTVVLTSQQNAQYTAYAADIYRADIEPVPGGGNVLGVLAMAVGGDDHVYAWRATEALDRVLIWKASPTGWQNVPLLNTIEFTTGGTAVPEDGDTLIQGGVTATIKRVMTREGELWTGTSAGAFVIDDPAGGSFMAGAATTSSGSTLTLSGTQTQIVIEPDGKYQFTICNFGGVASSRRAYGCDGINQAFEFDGETYAPITTGLDNDVPSNITNHKNHLFVSYGSGIYHSAPGLPFNWTAGAGAGAIATGDVVTGMITLPTGADTATMAVYQRTNTAFLYGTGLADWNFVLFKPGNGALQYSAQSLFDTFVFDDSGVITLKTSLNWGNFDPNVLTNNIQPFINQQRTKFSTSIINRTKSQYRLFFSDGFGLWCTIVNQKYLGAIPQQFPNPVFVACEAGTLEGGEVSYFASNDGNGYVYQLDMGTSFDGEALNAQIVMVWDSQRSNMLMKHYRGLSIEVQSNGYASLNFGYLLGYGSSAINQPTPVAYDSSFSPAPEWDVFVWDAFTWDGVTLTPTYVPMYGDGQNVSVTLSSATNYIPSYSLNSATYQFTPRRQMRP